MSDHKAFVRRLVDAVMNGNDLAVLDELCSPRLAPKVRTAFTQFREAFPDWHQDLMELVAEDSTVVARFRCTGTDRRTWQGLKLTGRAMRVDEVYFFRFTDDRISGIWGLEDTWTRMRRLAGDSAALGELGSLGLDKSVRSMCIWEQANEHYEKGGPRRRPRAQADRPVPCRTRHRRDHRTRGPPISVRHGTRH